MNEMFEKRSPVDMSPEAVAQRLRDLQQLYLLSVSLSRAKFVDSPELDVSDAAAPMDQTSFAQSSQAAPAAIHSTNCQTKR